jgi:hypothetical protein
MVETDAWTGGAGAAVGFSGKRRFSEAPEEAVLLVWGCRGYDGHIRRHLRGLWR